MTFNQHSKQVDVTWVLVADRGRARILSTGPASSGRFELIAQFEHPEGAMRMRDTVTDRQGYFGGRSGSLSAGQPTTDFRHQTAQEFAGELAEHLDKERNKGSFNCLILVAPPLFLGVLRDKLPSPLRQLVTEEFDRDYTALSDEEIAYLISRLLSSAELPEQAESSTQTAEEQAPQPYVVEHRGATVIVTVHGNLGEFAFELLENAATVEIARFLSKRDTRNVVIDLQNTEYFGSSALGFLVRLWKSVISRGGRMAVCHLSDVEREILTMMRLDSLWTLCETVEEAVRSVED